MVVQMSTCIGSLISVDCGEKGYMQGTLIKIDAVTKAITLSKPFKDGIPIGKDCIVSGSDVVGFKVIRPAVNPVPPLVIFDGSALPLEEPKCLLPDEPFQAVSAPAVTGKKWVPRPLSATNTVFKPLNFASSSESITSECPSTTSKSQSGVEMSHRKSIIGNRSITTSVSSDSNEAEVALLDTTPTPLFQRYEPQIPNPQKLRNFRKSSKGSKKQKGPSGIPVVDAQNGYGRVYPCNRHLTTALDALDDDFDFESNFEKFSEETMKDSDDKYFEAIEQLKVSKNFAHDENILSDPANLNSWTTQSAKSGGVSDSDCAREITSLDEHQFDITTCVTVRPGVRLPIMESSEKAKYMKACTRRFGESMFHSLIADKLLSYVFLMVEKYGIQLDRVVILHCGNAPIDAQRAVAGLLNRGVRVTMLSASFTCSDVKLVRDVHGLPANSDVVIAFGSLNSSCEKWLMSKTVHCFSVESSITLNETSRHHLIMVGTLTKGIYEKPVVVPRTGPTSFAMLCGNTANAHDIDWVVCDLGAPFSWINNSCDVLKSAFKHSLFVFS